MFQSALTFECECKSPQQMARVRCHGLSGGNESGGVVGLATGRVVLWSWCLIRRPVAFLTAAPGVASPAIVMRLAAVAVAPSARTERKWRRSFMENPLLTWNIASWRGGFS